MQDLIISAVSEYNYDKLKIWVNSINRSGFTGRKAVVAFNIKDETIKHLNDNGFEVWLSSEQRNKTNDGYHFADNITYQVPALRHFFYWKFLKDQKDIRYVISTDISDVVFQTNPSEWIDENFLQLSVYSLMYQSEGLKYKNEDWGNENFQQCFGSEIYEKVKDSSIYNAGSMMGRFNTFVDFSLNVALVLTNAQHNPTPDQAAVNLVLSLEPYKQITQFNNHDVSWACEAGTTVDPSKIDKFRPNLLCPEPIWDGEYVYNSKGEKYCMVHQYNRVPAWKDIIEKKYE